MHCVLRHSLMKLVTLTDTCKYMRVRVHYTYHVRLTRDCTVSQQCRVGVSERACLTPIDDNRYCMSTQSHSDASHSASLHYTTAWVHSACACTCMYAGRGMAHLHLQVCIMTREHHASHDTPAKQKNSVNTAYS